MYYLNKSDIELILGSGDMVFEYLLFANEKLAKKDDANAKKCLDKATKHKGKPLYITNDPDFCWLTNKKYIEEFLVHNRAKAPTAKMTFTNITKLVRGSASWQNKFLTWKHNQKMDVDSQDSSEAEEALDDFIPCTIFEGQKIGFEYKQGDQGVGYYPMADLTPISQNWSLPAKIERRSIPKQLRGQVWRNYFATIDHLCPLCDNLISIDDFECGHIVSVKNGGGNNPSNLMPLCGKCNKSMSSMNLDEYCVFCDLTVKYRPLLTNHENDQ
jgi:hypothetical protein